MGNPIHYYVPYGIAVSLPITAYAPLTSGTRQTCISGATGPVTADVLLSKDGAAFAAHTCTITQVGAQLYLLVMQALDLQCQRALVVISDAAGAAFDDVTVIVETKLQTHIYGDATQIAGANGIHGAGGTGGKPTNAFDTVLGAEPSGSFNALTSTVGEMLQHLLARWFHKVETNATQQVVYKRDNATILDQMAITPTASSVTRERA